MKEEGRERLESRSICYSAELLSEVLRFEDRLEVRSEEAEK